MLESLEILISSIKAYQDLFLTTTPRVPRTYHSLPHTGTNKIQQTRRVSHVRRISIPAFCNPRTLHKSYQRTSLPFFQPYSAACPIESLHLQIRAATPTATLRPIFPKLKRSQCAIPTVRHEQHGTAKLHARRSLSCALKLLFTSSIQLLMTPHFPVPIYPSIPHAACNHTKSKCHRTALNTWERPTNTNLLLETVRSLEELWRRWFWLSATGAQGRLLLGGPICDLALWTSTRCVSNGGRVTYFGWGAEMRVSSRARPRRFVIVEM
ncbi:hypothetical protein P154DRAFT_228765 [Amniculicola lignicola CBS 123094]|uniref:Uncharacterized protein n=1 Tax=Amniculicola lignicola CBS 123094 TaxID=1392246 RepID=A0A6A5WF56_9PLEO|nr:hypothetical protein P154DRAFT_228765 [Amniculicola lignicola CBS 123094]